MSEPFKDPLFETPKINVYNKEMISKMFSGDLNFETNYEAQNVMDMKKFKDFVQENFPSVLSNLKLTEQYFARLENLFYHLIHSSETPQDQLNKFMLNIDSKINQYFQEFDHCVLNNQPLSYTILGKKLINRQDHSSSLDMSSLQQEDGRISRQLQEDASKAKQHIEQTFNMSQFRQILKEEVIKISDKLNENFIKKVTPSGYEKKVIKKIESILRLYSFLRSDTGIICQYTAMKYGELFQSLVTGDGKQGMSYSDLLILNLDAIVENTIDAEFERTYPVFMHKKDLTVERLHDILKEREETIPEIVPVNIYKSILNRERRKVYRKIYATVMKYIDAPSKEERILKNKEILEQSQIKLVKQMNEIKNDFLKLKSEQTYIDIISGRLTERQVKETSLHFNNMEFFIKTEKFIMQSHKLLAEIQSTLSVILELKNDEILYFKDTFAKILNDSVLCLYEEEKQISKFQNNTTIPQLIRDAFSQLNKLISEDELQKALEEENQNKLINNQVQQGTQNKFLRDVDMYNQRNALDDQKRHQILQHKLKQDHEKYNKAMEALERDQDHLDKHKIDFPERDVNTFKVGLNRISEENKEKIEEFESTLKASKGQNYDTAGQSAYEKIMQLRDPSMMNATDLRLQKEQERLRQLKEIEENRKQKEINERQIRMDEERQRRNEEEQERQKQQREREEREYQERQKRKQEDEERRRRQEEEEQQRRQQREKEEQEYQARKRQQEEEEKQRREERDRQDREEREKREQQRRQEEEERQRRRQEEQEKRDREDRERREELDRKREQERRELEERREREKEEMERRREQDRLEREEQDRKRRQEQEEREKQRKIDEERRREEQKQREEEERLKREEFERKREIEREEQRQREIQQEKEREAQRQRQLEQERERKLQQEKEEQERRKREEEQREQERIRRQKQEQEEQERKRKQQEEEEETRKKNQQNKFKANEFDFSDDEDDPFGTKNDKDQQQQEKTKEPKRDFDYGAYEDDFDDDYGSQIEDPFASKQTKKSAQNPTKSGFKKESDDMEFDDFDIDDHMTKDKKKDDSASKAFQSISQDYDDDFEDITEDLPLDSSNHGNTKSLKKFTTTAAQQNIQGLDEIQSELEDDKFDSMDSQQDVVEQSGATMRSSYAYFENDFDMLKFTNEYIKSTKWGKQHKPDLNGLDNMDSFIQIFEEFIQLGTGFFFDYSHTEDLFTILEEKANQNEELDSIVETYMHSLRQYYNQYTGKVDFENDLLKMYFPFTPDNPFRLALIEKNPNKFTVNLFFFDDLPQDQQTQIYFQLFTQMFLETFECYQIDEDNQPQFWNVQSIKIDEKTVSYLHNNFQEQFYVHYILLVFSLIYEKDQDKFQGPNIMVNNQTAERVFYLNLGLSSIYEIIESQFEDLESFFVNMSEQHITTYQDNTEFFKKEYILDDDSLQEIMEDVLALKNKKKQLALALLKVQQVGEGEEEGYTFCYYLYVQKKPSSKFEVGIFTLENYGDQYNSAIENSIESLTQDSQIHVRKHRDFTRHNGLYDYSDLSFPLWCHILKNNPKLGPMEALSVLNFSMIPYFTTFKNLE